MPGCEVDPSLLEYQLEKIKAHNEQLQIRCEKLEKDIKNLQEENKRLKTHNERKDEIWTPN